jgi:predicted ArsR family transcriptional regulator
MSSEMRHITDPKAVRGLAHPLRWRILELLQTEGPMTATEVSDIVGESPANCSFHLRTLGKYGFIEEVGRGKGRTRPWRAVDISVEINEDEITGADKEANLAVGMLYRQAAAHQLDQWQKDRAKFPAKWRKAAFDTRFGLPLTAAELDELREHIATFIEKYRHRGEGPADALQVTFVATAFPIEDLEHRRRRLKRRQSS